MKTPLESRVLFDVLAVLIKRGGADAMQFAPRQHRLEQVGRIHGAISFSGAQQLVHFVDEQNDRAVRAFDFVEHAFETFFELAAVLCASDQCAEVEADDAAVLEAFGDVTGDDAPRKALNDGRLADAGLTDQHRVVLCAPREHLDDAPDLFVTADNRI